MKIAQRARPDRIVPSEIFDSLVHAANESLKTYSAATARVLGSTLKATRPCLSLPAYDTTDISARPLTRSKMKQQDMSAHQDSGQCPVSLFGYILKTSRSALQLIENDGNVEHACAKKFAIEPHSETSTPEMSWGVTY